MNSSWVVSFKRKKDKIWVQKTPEASGLQQIIITQDEFFIKNGSMNKKYNVKVNDDFKFDLESNEIADLDIVDVERKCHFSKFHIIQKNQSLQAIILKSDFLRKSYSVQINSNVYEVKISDELDLLIEEMGLSLGSILAINEIHAPMPGLILDVNIQEGDAVKEGDQLLVLEAMKMENTLTAPRDGTVKSVAVEKGQTVEKNELLIEME